MVSQNACVLALALLIIMAFPSCLKSAQALGIEDKFEPWLLDKIVRLEANRASQTISLIIVLNELMPDIKALKSNTASLLIEHHSAKDVYIASVLPFLTAKVNSTEVRAIATYQFVKILGDGEQTGEWTLDASTKTVHASYVWENLNYNGSGKIIAVLDSGINENHSGLINKVIDHIDYTHTGFEDAIDHGTHCAGIAAGTGAGSPQGKFYPGVAPGASLLNIKVGVTSPVREYVLAGIDWAVEHNADVISMSLGFNPFYYPNYICQACSICDMVEWAVRRGVIFVVSAGNRGDEGADSIICPGCSESAITVGAIDDCDTPSTNDDFFCGYSGKGPCMYDIKPDVVAPAGYPLSSGAKIMSPNSTGGYDLFGGTSAATPHVAGAAALILQAHPNWTPVMVKYALEATANLNDILQPLPESDRGKGIVDVARAISCSTEVPVDYADSKYENHWGNSDAIAYLNGTFRIRAEGDAGGDALAEARLNKTFTPSHDMSNPTFFFGFHDVGYMEADLGYTHLYATLKLWQGNTLLTSTEQLIHDINLMSAYSANCYHAIQLTYQGKLLFGQQYKLEYGLWTFAHVAWSNFYDTPWNIIALHLTAIDTIGVGNPSFEERVGSVSESWHWASNSDGWRNLKGDVNGDGEADLLDLVLIQAAFGSRPGDPNWNPDADLNGDNIVDLLDLTICAGDFGKPANNLDGFYSWYTGGGGDYNISQWLCDHDINAMKGNQINFTFWFKPETVAPDGTQNYARAEIRYIFANGTTQTINGNWVYPTQIQWYTVSITTTIPTDTIAIKIVIHGTPDFKAWIDKTSITIT